MGVPGGEADREGERGQGPEQRRHITGQGKPRGEQELRAVWETGWDHRSKCLELLWPGQALTAPRRVQKIAVFLPQGLSIAGLKLLHLKTALPAAGAG